MSENSDDPIERNPLIQRLKDIKKGSSNANKSETLPIRMESDLYEAAKWWADVRKTTLATEIRESLVKNILGSIDNNGALAEKFSLDSICPNCESHLPSPWENIEHQKIFCGNTK